MIRMLAAALLLAYGALAYAQAPTDATYRYQSGNFIDVMGSYTTSDSVSGFFTTAEPLARSLPTTDISGLLTSYSFSDGVQTLTNSNSVVVSFSVATDPAGVPSTYTLTVYRAPATANPIAGIDIGFTGQFEQVDGFSGVDCGDFSGPGGQCSSAIPTNAPNYGFLLVGAASPGGTWVFTPGVASSIAVPTLSATGLVVLGLAIVIVVGRRRSLA